MKSVALLIAIRHIKWHRKRALSTPKSKLTKTTHGGRTMLFFYHNKITSNCQYYRIENITNHPNPHCHTRVISLKEAKDFLCPCCQSRMYSYGAFSVLIKDFSDCPEEKNYIEFSGHRFRCTSCGETITEDIPC